MKVIKIYEEGYKDEKPPKVNGTDIEIRLNKEDFIEYNEDPEHKCFRVIGYNEFTKKVLNNENVWAYYKFKKVDYERYKSSKLRYEDTVCGFLEYYDREVRSGMTDNSIFFHWGKWGKDEYCIVVFMYDPPLRYPYKKPLYERDEYVTNEYYSSTEEIEPPPNSQLSDPPKPPPPPPPY